MNAKTLFGIVVLGLGCFGCGQNVGWMIKPVPIEEEMAESVVASDPGFLIPNKIAIIDVDGLLMNRRDDGFFGEGENPVSMFIEKLDKAQDDPAVKALLLRVNSPGGGVTASDIMYRRLMRFREEKHVPVIAVMEDVAASGAYYISCGADTIIAHPTTVTGSIGVIVQTVSFAGTLSKLGITAQAVVSGPRKDMGSPFKPLDEKDTAILQGLVNDMYKRFLAVVAKGRPKLTAERIKELADGRVYTGEQAKANGLVDELGYMDQAVVAAKKAAGVSRAKVVIYHRPVGYRANVYSQSQVPLAGLQLPKLSLADVMAFARPQFLYMWSGNGTGE